MKNENFILPNPNQLIFLRKLQKEICDCLNESEFCAVPSLPICLKCENLFDLNAKITKIEANEIESDEEGVFLSVNLEINEKNESGKIELCKFNKNYGTSEEKNQIFASMKNLLQNQIAEIKKISPFRICEMETEDFVNGKKWKILREKWGKI